MSKKLSGTSLAGSSVSRERADEDYYATPTNSTKALLEIEEFKGDPIIKWI